MLIRLFLVLSFLTFNVFADEVDFSGNAANLLI